MWETMKQKKHINCIQRFVKTNSHTNFILMYVPHGYDLKQNSCVNKEVKSIIEGYGST